MSVTSTLMKQLHRLNRQKSDLEGQLKRGPKTVALAAQKVKNAEQSAQDEQAKLTRMRVDADSKQLQMKEREEKIYSWEGKLNMAKEPREYQALKDQIAADTQANVVLSDEILEILEGIDAQQVTLKQAHASVKVAKDEFEQISGNIGAKKVLLEADLERVNEELKTAEKELSGDLKSVYLRLVSRMGEDAMSALEDRCCGGCYQSLTPQLLDRLKIQQPVLCPSCARIIYDA